MTGVEKSLPEATPEAGERDDHGRDRAPSHE
jgi:hypothetical protein